MQSGEVQQYNSYDKVLEQRKKVAPNGCLPYALLLRKYGKSLFESEKSSKILLIEASYNCSNDENREIIFQKCCDVFSFISPFTDVIDALKSDFEAYSPQWQGILNIDFEDYILHSTSIESDNDRKFLLFANRFTEFYFRSIAPAIDFTKLSQSTEKQNDNETIEDSQDLVLKNSYGGYFLTPREKTFYQKAVDKGYIRLKDNYLHWVFKFKGKTSKVSLYFFLQQVFISNPKDASQHVPNKAMEQLFNVKDLRGCQDQLAKQGHQPWQQEILANIFSS